MGESWCNEGDGHRVNVGGKVGVREEKAGVGLVRIRDRVVSAIGMS